MATTQPARPPWVDRRLQHLPAKPWRKVHLDYHNTPFVGKVGHRFEPEEFVERLQRGHVDAIVVFAKDMHGYFYFPSERGPVHPGLERDLLGEQVVACRQAGIAVYGYYCVTWDHLLAEQHPEWLVVKEDRTTYLPHFDETPGWTALCLSNRDFVDLVLADSREILSGYELDGIWYDMPLPIRGECFCRNCLAAIRAQGSDPFDVRAQRRHKQELLTGFLRETRQTADALRPGCQIDQNNQTRLGLQERIPYFDNVDIEALPTGGWGYQYFPIDARYSRTAGKSIYGQTGRFHEGWADFGGLKHPRQLAAEVAGIVAQGAHCCIGDQAPPSARLDEAVYETIGQAYKGIADIEDVLEGAAPVVEAAIVVDGLPLLDPASTRTGSASPDPVDPMIEGVVGASELLVDHRIQFDVVEPDAETDLDRYRLLVLPDGLEVSEQLAEQLSGYVERGGALLALGGTVAVADGAQSWIPGLDLKTRGKSPFVPAYLLPAPALRDRLAPFEYALYTGTAEWEVAESGDTEVWAHVGVPAFQRSPEHYTSHRQSPFAEATDMPAVVRSGHVAATSFDLGAAYHRTGYWPYREIFGAILDAILPLRLVRSDAPRCVEITVTEQARDQGTRWVVHAVNGATGRRWGPHLEHFEDAIELRDIRISLDLPGTVDRAWRAGAEPTPLEIDRVTGPDPAPDGRTEILIGALETSCVIVLDAADASRGATALS